MLGRRAVSSLPPEDDAACEGTVVSPQETSEDPQAPAFSQQVARSSLADIWAKQRALDEDPPRWHFLMPLVQNYLS